MLMLNEINLENAKRNENATKLAQDFSDFCNSNSMRSGKDFAILSMQDHPTVLQAKMRCCISFIELMSQRKGDLRTEASENLARLVMNNTTEQDRTLPLI